MREGSVGSARLFAEQMLLPEGERGPEEIIGVFLAAEAMSLVACEQMPGTAASRPLAAWHWAQSSACSLGATIWVIGQSICVSTKPN